MRVTSRLALLLIAVLLWCAPAYAAVCSNVTIITANVAVSNVSNDRCLYVDTTAGAVTLTVDAPSVFGSGEFTILKIGNTSAPVIILGSFQNSQSEFRLANEGDVATLHSDASTWKIMPSFAVVRGFSLCRSEHVVSTPSNAVNKQDGGFCYIVDVYAAGTSIYIALPPIASVAFDHMNFTITFHRFDSGPTSNSASIVSNAVLERIKWYPLKVGNAGGGLDKVDMTANFQTLSMYTQGSSVWFVLLSQGFCFNPTCS
jgi:hypothetical protein